MAGSLFETYVVSEILKQYANKGLDLRSRFAYYRDNNGKEIDLLIIENNKLYPIEVKKNADPGKSALKNFSVLKSLAEETGEGAVICLSSMPYPLDKSKKFPDRVPAGFVVGVCFIQVTDPVDPAAFQASHAPVGEPEGSDVPVPDLSGRPDDPPGTHAGLGDLRFCKSLAEILYLFPDLRGAPGDAQVGLRCPLPHGPKLLQLRVSIGFHDCNHCSTASILSIKSKISLWCSFIDAVLTMYGGSTSR